MALTLRRIGLSPPIYSDQVDYTVHEDGQEIGRIYEVRGALPELRWFWSITVVVDARAGVRADGRAATFGEAKAQIQENWGKCKAWAKIAGKPTLPT
jgi:hypothetical protein